MPFNPSPTGYLPGIQNLASGVSAITSGIFIPFSSIEGYNPSGSGDIRQLVYGIIESTFDTISGLATADRPSKFTLTRSSALPSDNVIRNTYTIVVNLDYGDLTVTPE